MDIAGELPFLILFALVDRHQVLIRARGRFRRASTPYHEELLIAFVSYDRLQLRVLKRAEEVVIKF